MHLTVHGEEHILDRTSMLAKDVLSIISGNATVELGTSEGYEYLLFYSPNDRDCKIAIVSLGKKDLVSVWEKDYFLPKGVLKVTHPLTKKARLLFSEFMFKRVKIEEVAPQMFMVQVDISSESKIEYRQSLGMISQDEIKTLESPLSILSLLPELRPIITIVEQNRLKVPGKLYYKIYVLEQGSGKIVKKSFKIKHETFMNRLRTAE
jgi:hypothetical protein